jgi:hypothetical protein
MMMNKDEFFASLSAPLKESVVCVDGRNYRLREMTEEQGTQYELMIQDKAGRFDFSRARRAMIAIMLLDDSGNRIVDDESQLKAMPRSLAGVLFDECQKLNRYDPGDVKALVKNFDEVPG